MTHEQYLLGKLKAAFDEPTEAPSLDDIQDEFGGQETQATLLSAALEYTRFDLKGRWPEAEKYILTSPAYSFFYASYVIKGRWPEAEPIILSDPHYGIRYRAEFKI